MAILGGILGDLLDPVKDIVSEVVVDKDKKLEVQFKLKELEDRINERLHEEVLAQVEVNKVEAASGSVFVAGWRPFVGWVCGFGLGYSAILQPFLNWGSRVVGYMGELPALNDTTLITVLGGMLGIGIMRSWEKGKGVSTNDYVDVPAAAPVTTTVEVDAKSGAVSVETTPPKKKKKTFGIF